MRLSEAARQRCQEAVAPLPGQSQQARRARLLLQVAADGPNWPDRRVAGACGCRVQTVANGRKRCLLEDCETALERRSRDPHGRPPDWGILPQANAEFVAALERGRQTYEQPHDASHPVVCRGEKPVQLVREARCGSVQARQRAVHWHLTAADARTKLNSVYPKIIV